MHSKQGAAIFLCPRIQINNKNKQEFCLPYDNQTDKVNPFMLVLTIKIFIFRSHFSNTTPDNWCNRILTFKKNSSVYFGLLLADIPMDMLTIYFSG